jgi:hypothetical protein
MVNMSHSPRTSSTLKWNNAPTRSVDVAGTSLVYRQLGPATSVPPRGPGDGALQELVVVGVSALPDSS